MGAIPENVHVRVEIATDGQLVRVTDKLQGPEVLPPGQNGNILQAFEDRPIRWDAWDIDVFFEDRLEVIDQPQSLEIIAFGPIRVALRVTTKGRSSTITQTIRLHAHSARIDFETEVDWHETHTFLKAAFRANLETNAAQFDIQWGFVARGTARDTPFDTALFEGPAQKWAQVSEPGCAVALLNDCKYGYDLHHGIMRITLIKSLIQPNPGADQGRHGFTCALLPILGADRAVLDREAYEVNAPCGCWIRCWGAGFQTRRCRRDLCARMRPM